MNADLPPSSSGGFNDLRKYSPLTAALERVFFVLQFLSPASWFIQTRAAHQRAFPPLGPDVPATMRRSRQIERYLYIWFAVQVVLAISLAISAPMPAWIPMFLSAWRVFDIMQSAINSHLFDRLRTGTRPDYVPVYARAVILNVWNYLEMIICFGIFYSAKLEMLENAKSWADAYYFSVITQLTIGYGDINPLGWLRPVAAVQGILGFLYGLIVLTRLIAFLPRAESVLDAKSDAKPHQ
jgi:hypothetical protein